MRLHGCLPVWHWSPLGRGLPTLRRRAGTHTHTHTHTTTGELLTPTLAGQVWNPTVANLTLMALGSSAPEILLSLTDTIGAKKFYAGALGERTAQVWSWAIHDIYITPCRFCTRIKPCPRQQRTFEPTHCDTTRSVPFSCGSEVRVRVRVRVRVCVCAVAMVSADMGRWTRRCFAVATQGTRRRQIHHNAHTHTRAH